MKFDPVNKNRPVLKKSKSTPNFDFKLKSQHGGLQNYIGESSMSGFYFKIKNDGTFWFFLTLHKTHSEVKGTLFPHDRNQNLEDTLAP